MSKQPDGSNPNTAGNSPKSDGSQSPQSQHGHGSSKTTLNQQQLKTAGTGPIGVIRASVISLTNAVERASKLALHDKDKKAETPTVQERPKSRAPPKEEDDPEGTKSMFIYGGPFIKLVKPSMFLDSNSPINVPLQGTFRRSYAYHSLKERLPVILTKVIDYCSRESGSIKSKYGASDDDIQIFVRNVSELKSDLVTNKNYKELKGDGPDVNKWNGWIAGCDPPNYFGNVWCWTECYVYRRLKDACDMTAKLKNFDYFEESKNAAFQTNLEPMCVVAERMFDMLNKGERAKTKEDFITLLKICMWSNRCDMSLSVGEQVPFSSAPPPPPPNQPPPAPAKGKKKAPPPPPPDPGYIDPFLMITNNKDYLLVDDSGKAFEALTKKADALTTKIANAPEGYQPPAAAVEGEEPPKIPCPAKMVIPQCVIFDIVCDNAGYELFTDLCFAHFLIAQELVQKVRFHVKKFPWFVSDVTENDFRFVIESCKNASFNKTVQPPAPAPLAEGEEPPPAKVINSEYLKALGQQWSQLVEDGTFMLMAEDYWTYPHGYRDMKKHDPNLYRKLQFPVMILFKGDLNYRKLLGDRNVVSIQTLELSMQGFLPAPIIAARTIKSELVCGLPKAKANQPSKSEQLNALDDKWMTKGYWAVIQLCAKAETFKPSVVPCIDYGDTCFSQTCPIHSDI